jgi:hypothetical protein
MALLDRELIVILTSHLLALIPIGGVSLAGRMNVVYRVPSPQLARLWAWTALVIVVVMVLGNSGTG